MAAKRSDPSFISPEDMRIFVALETARTLTEAASSLELTLPTVSRAVKRMESAAQVRLLRRDRDGLQFTAVGRDFLSCCRSTLKAHRAAIDALDAHRRTPEGLLNVASPVTFARHVLAEILPDFQSLFPQLKVDVQLYCADWDQQPKACHDGFLKVRTPSDSDRHLKLFPAVRQGLFASAAYLEKYPEPGHPLDLDAHSSVGYDRIGGLLPWNLSNGNQRLALKPNFNVAVADPHVLLRLTIRGAGVSLLPLWVANPYVKTGELVPILRKWIPDPLVFCALYDGQAKQSSKESAFLEFLESVLGTERDPRCQGEEPAKLFIN